MIGISEVNPIRYDLITTKISRYLWVDQINIDYNSVQKRVKNENNAHILHSIGKNIDRRNFPSMTAGVFQFTCLLSEVWLLLNEKHTR